MDQIEHVIVLMMENRPLDNLAGWLYEPDSEPQPRKIIGRQNSPNYNGLAYVDYYNPEPPTGNPLTPTTSADRFRVPTPDPHEGFEHMNFQIFGTKKPKEGHKPA